jgi:hypothetical protein
MNYELDKRVAVEVMGYQFSMPPGMVSNKWWRKLPDGYIDVCFDGCPSYSEYIDAAWKVVEELQKRMYQVVLIFSSEDKRWSCRLWQRKPYELVVSTQPTAPLAICHAALDICEKPSTLARKD